MQKFKIFSWNFSEIFFHKQAFKWKLGCRFLCLFRATSVSLFGHIWVKSSHISYFLFHCFVFPDSFIARTRGLLFVSFCICFYMLLGFPDTSAVRILYLSSNMLSKKFYASLVVDIFRICRVTTNCSEFKSLCEKLSSRKLNKGAVFKSSEIYLSKADGWNFQYQYLSF